jgi:hypothetical protein
LGTTLVTWSATDTAGNTGTATQSVTLTDTTAPVLTVPADATATSDIPVAVAIGTATATDIFTPVTINNDAPALFPVGSTIVTWTATDANGNSVTGTQTVTVTAPPAANDFVDDFSRADGSVIGNGWVEKNPAAFALQGNRVAVQGTGAYWNNLVYRPASENSLDVEASVEFDLIGSYVGYPELFVRLQTDTAQTPDNFTAYLLYIAADPSIATLNRHGQGGYGTSLANINLNPALAVGDTYRLRLRAEGTDPVQLDAFVERFNGTGWDIIGQTSFADADPNRITTPGSVGFSGDAETGYLYDNFRRSLLNATPAQ